MNNDIWNTDLNRAPKDHPILGKDKDGVEAKMQWTRLNDKIELFHWTTGEPDKSNPNWVGRTMFYPLAWREITE